MVWTGRLVYWSIDMNKEAQLNLLNWIPSLIEQVVLNGSPILDENCFSSSTQEFSA